MTSRSSRQDALFQRIARRCDADPRISRGKMVVSDGLRIDGRFFAALVRGELLVKLPRERGDELVSGGIAAPFRSGNARVMKEWALISASASRHWRALVDEARAFVG